jgi:hypothetical protein
MDRFSKGEISRFEILEYGWIKDFSRLETDNRIYLVYT